MDSSAIATVKGDDFVGEDCVYISGLWVSESLIALALMGFAGSGPS